MDPISISIGVAGFLSLTLEIINILSNYVSNVKSAPEEANGLLREITALKVVLE
jgi:hypothetical protein